jgi:hypothetical protein
MLSSLANVIICDKMLSVGANVIILDEIFFICLFPLTVRTVKQDFTYNLQKTLDYHLRYKGTYFDRQG